MEALKGRYKFIRQDIYWTYQVRVTSISSYCTTMMAIPSSISQLSQGKMDKFCAHEIKESDICKNAAFTCS